MTIRILLACLVLFAFCVFAYYKSKGQKKKGVKTLVYIDGMTCPHCAARVEKAFLEQGAKEAKVHLEEKYAEILAEAPLDEASAKETVETLGFTFVKIEF